MSRKKERLYLFEYNFISINIFCFVLTALFILITVGIYNLFDFNFVKGLSEFNDFNFFVFILLMCGWLMLHELIHGLSYVFHGAKSKNIKYGVVLEKSILYCKCGEYINKSNILWSVINPYIYIGIVTYFMSFAFGSVTLLFLSLLNISGACADILMFFFFLKRDKKMKFKEIKDSSTFILKTTEDLTDKKFFAVKRVKELEEDIVEDKEKLITVTKISKWVIVILIILSILSLIVSFL